MTNLNIITPREPLTDGKGMVTRSWWRFFEALFQAAGGYNGGAASLIDVQTLAFSNFGPSGPDYATEIAELRELIMTQQSVEGRIAALETRMQAIENSLANVQSPRVDVLALRRQLDTLTAWTMGTH